MTTLEWLDDGNKEGGVAERQFVIKGGRGPVPGIMWSPEPAETPCRWCYSATVAAATSVTIDA